jgi:hypothetical protein
MDLRMLVRNIMKKKARHVPETWNISSFVTWVFNSWFYKKTTNIWTLNKYTENKRYI